ncbi:MAG: hypothetical protein RLZZ226_454 [Pseudomonadota bacterium]
MTVTYDAPGSCAHEFAPTDCRGHPGFMLFFLFLLLFSGAVWSAELELAPNFERVLPGSVMEYAFDDSSQLDISAASDLRYRPLAANSLTLGYRASVLWVRWAVRNTGSVPLDAILQVEPERLEKVWLFVPGSEDSYRRLDNGIQVALPQRPLVHRTLAFPLRFEPGQSRIFHLRIETRNALSFMPVLWSPSAFTLAMQKEDWFTMIGVGFILGLAGYSILLFPLQRERPALFLGFALIFSGMAELSLGGYGVAYLWPGHSEWALRAPMVFIMLMLAAVNRFNKAFLDLEGPARRGTRYWRDLVLMANLGIVAGHLLSLPFAYMGPLSMLVLVASILSQLGFTWGALLRGYQPARYVILGQILVILATLVRVGESLGWLPFTFLSSQPFVPLIGYGAALIFFAALSRRVDSLLQEKVKNQSIELEIQRNTSARLEMEVAERTRELSQAKERAEQADRAKGEFMARVSHELRTPLHTILGYATLLRHDLGSGKVGECLSMLEDGGRHLMGLIEDLLDYARFGRDNPMLSCKPVFLHRLLNRLDDHGVLLAEQRMNRYRSLRGQNLPVAIRVDERRLEQAVLVLLSNAASYTDQGVISLDVVAEPVSAECTRLRFRVTDNGIGIASADLSRIFEPFERAVRTGVNEGLGLGLPIARQIVRTMGGDIEVSSQPGEGSWFEFSVALPLAREADVEMSLGNNPVQGYEGYTRRILLLEDTAAHRQLLEHLLSDLGFEVRGAGSLQEARKRMEQELFDLALLDQWLPDGTAHDLLPELARVKTGAVPAILVSAMPAAPPPGFDASFQFEAILLKPVVLKELLDVLGRALDLRWIHVQTVGENHPQPVARAPSSWGNLAELIALADAGSVYEIEEWVADARQDASQYRDWLDQVEVLVTELDFEGIMALAERR